jgi:BMFP domain-containing protein YqiC
MCAHFLKNPKINGITYIKQRVIFSMTHLSGAKQSLGSVCYSAKRTVLGLFQSCATIRQRLHHPIYLHGFTTMINKNIFQEISQQIASLLPQAEAAKEEIKKSVALVLQTGFARLELLTREDFEAQTAALARAEQRIAELEQEMSRLEALLPPAP